jgi:hypothetical protein
MIDGNQPRAAWVWMDDAGTYFLPIQYGRHQFEALPGSLKDSSAALGKPAKVEKEGFRKPRSGGSRFRPSETVYTCLYLLGADFSGGTHLLCH